MSTSVSKPWTEIEDEERKTHILGLLNGTEVSDRDKRMTSVRAVLYLCQGNASKFLGQHSLIPQHKKKRNQHQLFKASEIVVQSFQSVLFD